MSSYRSRETSALIAIHCVKNAVVRSRHDAAAESVDPPDDIRLFRSNSEATPM